MQDYYKPLTIAGIIFIIFGLIAFGVFYSEKKLSTLREEYNRLENRRVSLQSSIKTLHEQNKILSDINSDKFVHSNSANLKNGLVDFYSQVQKIFSDRDITITSTRQQDNSIVMSIQGDYYSFMNTIADLRAMSTPSKINTINIRRNPAHTHLIAADLTIEAMLN